MLAGLFATLGCQRGRPEVHVEGVEAVESSIFVDAVSFFMTIENKGTAKDRLLSARIKEEPHARIELHDVAAGNMRRIDAIEVRAGETVMLKRGGMHLMAFDVQNARGGLRLVLHFEKSGDLELKVHLTNASARPG